MTFKATIRKTTDSYVISMGGKSIAAFYFEPEGQDTALGRALDFTDGMFFALRSVGIDMNREIKK